MSEPSLQAARLHSLGVLVVAYVGLSFSTVHHERLSTLWEARQAIATILLDRKESGSVPGLGYVSVDESSSRSGNQVQRVVVTADGSRWVVSDADSIEQNGYALLRRVAVDLGVEDVPIDDAAPVSEYVLAYRRIAARAGEGLEVPGTGIRFFGAKAVWACAIFVAGLLVVMRDRIQHVLRDPKLARGERWLAVDGYTGLERVLAVAEVLALSIAPTALTGGLVLVITSQLIADGADTSLFSDVVTGALALSLLVVNAWLSLTVTAHVLELRRLRKELLGDPVVEGAERKDVASA